MAKQDETKTGPSQTDSLITLGKLEFEIVITHESDCLAYPIYGPKVAMSIYGIGNSLTDALMRLFKEQYGKVPKKYALEEATRMLVSDAYQRPKVKAHLRHARAGNDLYLDLGDETGRAIQFSDGAWEVIERPPVYFRRSELIGALPVPTGGGSVEELFSILRIPRKYQSLITGFLVASLDPSIPIPILSISGEQGTGKSTLVKKIRALIDPSPLETQSAPSDESSWAEIAGSARLIAFDNLSEISNKVSDLLCKAVTGDSSAKRKLYTDSNSIVRRFRPIIMLNGISVAITRDDLADRILSVHLSVISDAERLEESLIESRWSEHLPSILGAIYSIAAKVYEELPNVRLAEMPRMADFARVLGALDKATGINSLSDYRNEIGSLAANAIENDTFLSAVEKGIHKVWDGTSAELCNHLTPFAGDVYSSSWPQTPREMTEKITRSAPTLRKLGWEVSDLGSNNQKRTKRWRIVPPLAI